MNRLSGKNIVVTGATSGIGKISAIKLAENGANLVLCGRDKVKGEAVIQEIIDKHGKAVFIKCDVTNKNEVDNLFDLAFSQMGSIDCLFNNAGTPCVRVVVASKHKPWGRKEMFHEAYITRCQASYH